MNKKELYSTVQRSTSMSCLFSVCKFLEMSREELEQLGTDAKNGLSKDERKKILELSYKTHELKSEIGRIATVMFEEFEHKCDQR